MQDSNTVQLKKIFFLFCQVRSALFTLCVVLGTFSSCLAYTVVLYDEPNHGKPFHYFSSDKKGGTGGASGGGPYDVRYTFDKCFDKDASSALVSLTDHQNECFCFHVNADGLGLTTCFDNPKDMKDLKVQGIDKMVSAVSVYPRNDPRCIKGLHHAVAQAASPKNSCL